MSSGCGRAHHKTQSLDLGIASLKFHFHIFNCLLNDSMWCLIYTTNLIKPKLKSTISTCKHGCLIDRITNQIPQTGQRSFMVSPALMHSDDFHPISAPLPPLTPTKSMSTFSLHSFSCSLLLLYIVARVIILKHKCDYVLQLLKTSL